MVATVFLNLHHVDVALLAAEVVFAELVIDTLGNIVHTPVHAVQEKVDVEGVHACMTHLALHAAGPHVACVLCVLPIALAPVLPAVTKMAAQDKLVELRGLVFTKERVFQRLRTAVLLLEHQSERMFRVLLGQTTVTAVQAQTAVHAEIVAATEQLYTGRSRPAVAGIVAHRWTGEDVDATAYGVVFVTEEVVFVSDDAQHGQLPESLDNLGSQCRVVGHLRVHLVVGYGSSADGGVLAPCVRIAFRVVGLLQYVIGEEIGSGGDGCHRARVGNSNGTQDGIARHL